MHKKGLKKDIQGKKFFGASIWIRPHDPLVFQATRLQTTNCMQQTFIIAKYAQLAFAIQIVPWTYTFKHTTFDSELASALNRCFA